MQLRTFHKYSPICRLADPLPLCRTELGRWICLYLHRPHSNARHSTCGLPRLRSWAQL